MFDFVHQGISLAFMGMPGGSELFIILLIILVLFGGAKLPSLMRNLGRSANEFKKGMSETAEDDGEAGTDNPAEKA
ncbi:twin-arginine translocase TatA/TatE family subunit [Crateriforma conspicua]|uniref:Sec-independent protein translocase protein TatA n=1 Tax=Crateriforma conspicua TaxID=2527996 RepID=A0A5C5Y8Y6_9PLAN|nr:twin-arginine translocase TatA/TatE family subunit [Crateriforma conspicua]TWT69822.1 twin arginine translocase protein A [Crateriforma conspicua]